MRVCLVSRELAPFWGAGIGTYTAAAAAAWAAAGHDTHLLCPRHANLSPTSPDLPRGVTLHTIDPALSDTDLAPRPYEFQRYAMRIRRTLERLHASTPFDYIEFPEYWAEGHEALHARRAEGAFPGAILAVRLHTPTHECRALNRDTTSTPETAALEAAEDRAIRDADLILSPTRSLLDIVSRRLNLPPHTPPRTVTPYPFFSLSPSHPLTPSPSHSTNSTNSTNTTNTTNTTPPELLYFGRLERRKGVHLLVEAAVALLHSGLNASFRFIGADTRDESGSTLDQLRALIPASLAPRFRFDPAIPRAQLPAAIRTAIDSGGACCFPSIWENFPNACLEAMSLGAPVVASDAGGMAEIIEHESSGLLFGSGDSASLQSALRRILTDHPLRARLAAAAPARISSLCDPAAVTAATVAAIKSARAAARPVPRPLRIALVSREFAPFFGGGIGSYISQTCAVLAAAGHEVHVLTGPHENLLQNAPYLRPGVRFHTVDMDSGRAALDAYPNFPMRYAMAVHEALTRLSADQPFDYIEFPDYHAEGYFAIRAKRTLGHYPRSILSVRLHSPAWLCREADRDARLDLEAATIEHMERAAVAEADLVLSPTAAGLARIARSPRPCLSLSHQPRTAILPCPINIQEMLRELGESSPSLSHPLTPSPSHPAEVLFFGKLQHLKGPHDLVAAALLLLSRGTRARFRFIGNDSPTGPFGRSMLDFLRSRIPPEHSHAFTFDPALPRRDLAAAIRRASASGGLCCFPSHWESFPNVCIEAMILGAPVVASDVGGLAAIVEHERSGVLHPVADPPALAAAIERLLTDHPLRARLAAAGPDRIRTLCNAASIAADLGSLIRQFHAELAEGAEINAGTKTPGSPASEPSDLSIPISAPSASSARNTPASSARTPLTILIPFYNLAPYLPDTLASLDRQTRRDFSTIIINDGSTDPASLTLLAHLERTRPDLRIIHQPNRGLSATRNAGLHAATTPYIMPLDADDLIAPTLVEKALAALAADPALTFVSPLVSYFETSPDRSTGGWVPLGPDRDLLVAQNCAAAASGTVIDRAAALAVNGYDESLTSYEDWDFWCRLAESGHRGTVLPEFLLHYRVRPDSMYRTEATARHTALHAYILSRHPNLPANPSRAMRLLASLGASASDARLGAQALIAQNIRYRMADKVNNALKRTGVQRALKGLTVRVLRSKRRTRES